MSDWSTGAAAKFQQKQQDENLKNQILKHHASDQFKNLEEAFTSEIHKFNTASGNRVILNLYQSDDGVSFEVALDGTSRRLHVSFDKMKYGISIHGKGGPSFDEKLMVMADLQSQATYLTNRDSAPVEAGQIVRKALEALLGI